MAHADLSNTLASIGSTTAILTRCIGSGTHGAVYVASVNQAGQPVRHAALKAIKVPEAGHVVRNELLLRDKAECRSLGAHVCRLLHNGDVRTHHVFLYELLDNTLDSILRDGDLQFDEAILLNHVVRGVAALNNAGLLHRDIKPANIMLRNGIAKIIDFGLVRDLDDRARPMTPQLYTLWYRPPEVLLGMSYDRPADAWATGVVGMELICRAPVLRADSELGMLRSIADLANVRRLSRETILRVEHPDIVTHCATASASQLECSRVCGALVRVSPTRRSALDAHVNSSPAGARVSFTRSKKRARTNA